MYREYNNPFYFRIDFNKDIFISLQFRQVLLKQFVLSACKGYLIL